MHDEEKRKNYELAERLISEQNFFAAAIAGCILGNLFVRIWNRA